MSHNPKDNQALLQSMLQRLKLQPGREGQSFPCQETPSPVTVGGRGDPSLQNVSNSSLNGFQLAADKGREVQPPSHCEVDRGVTSCPSHKGNTHEDTREKSMLGPTTLPDVTLTGREELVPVESLKDADMSSFASSVMGHTLGDEHAVQEQNQGFTPKIYMWSLKSTDASTDVGGEVSKMGNGDSEESKDEQCVASSPTTSNSSLRRKQRPSENRTRRWTQKIKERWRDKHGSFSKKAKEEGGRMAQTSEQVNKICIK